MIPPDAVLAAPLLALLAERIEVETGLHFPFVKRRELIRAVSRMAESKGYQSDESCIDWLLGGRWDAEKAQLCARHLTIGETYFFREPRALDLVCDYARKKLDAGARAGATLKLWSAGCSTGEEPYSIAMALARALPVAASERVSILATDLNPDHLEFARAGLYRQWSFRRAGTELQERHFKRTADGRLRIDAALAQRVRFAQLNLALPVYPSVATSTHAIDIIFCRNVLMYFSRSQMKLAIARFRLCLVEGGWLVVNPSEASAELFDGFTAFYFPDAVYYQKISEVALAPPVLLASVADDRRPAPVRPAQPAGAGAVAEAGTAVPRAYALARAGEAEAALLCLAKAIEAAPMEAALHQARAFVAMESGDQALARQGLQSLLYLQPDSILGHYLEAVMEMEQGRPAAAVRRFEASRDLLALLGDDALVPGSDGWPASSLRASVEAWLEQAR